MSDACSSATRTRSGAVTPPRFEGSFDEAIAAYREAAGIAPDRAMPQASLAGILARTGRISEALAAYDVALARQPEDEASLRGRAEMLVDRRSSVRRGRDARPAGRRPRAGRPTRSTPAEVARRALELAESRSRRAGSRGDGRAAPRGRRGADGRCAGRVLGTIDAPAVAASRGGRRGQARSAQAGARGSGRAGRGGRDRARRRRHRRGAALLPGVRGGAAVDRQPPRGARPVLPGARHLPRRTAASTSPSPSCTSTAAGGCRRPTSWSCSAGCPSSVATT